MIVTSGGVVRIYLPVESVVVRATGVKRVVSGCVVMVLVQSGAPPPMIVTRMVDKCPIQLCNGIVTRGRG